MESKVGMLFAAATSTLKTPASWLLQALGVSATSSAGVNVSINSVLGIPEVYSAVQKITGHLAQMEIECKYTPAGSEGQTIKVESDLGYRALKYGSEFFTGFTLIEKLMLDALLYGNGRLFIERNSQGQPINLYPIQAEDSTTVVSGGERWHTVTINSGTEIGSMTAESEAGTLYKIPDRDVLYVMGISRNGWWGENPIQILKDTFGLAIAGQEAAGATFRNAGRPGLMLEAPRTAFKTAKEREDFLAEFNAATAGLDKAGKTGLIHSGMTAHVMKSPDDNKGYVSQRQFQRESVAMAFLLESVFGDNTGSVYKSVTERNSAYMTNCLGRWIRKIECECDAKLLSRNQRRSGGYCYKMNRSILLRQDQLSLAQYTSNLRQQLCISGNEIREMHGLSPRDGLDGDYTATMGISEPVGSDPEPEESVDEESADEESEDDEIRV